MKFRETMTSRSGLTLVELMITMMLTTLLMGAVYLAYQIQHRTGTEQQAVAALQNDLRAVMDIMSRDIRNAGCNPDGVIFSVFMPNSGQYEIGLQMDLDDSGAITTSEQVQYWHDPISDTVIRQQLNEAQAVLAQNVTTMAFAYYGQDGKTLVTSGSGTANPADNRNMGDAVQPHQAYGFVADDNDSIAYVDVKLVVEDPTKQFERVLWKRFQLRNWGL